MTVRRRTTSCFPVNNMGQLDVDYHTSKQISQKPRLRLDYSLAFLVEILAGRIAHRLAEILAEEGGIGEV